MKKNRAARLLIFMSMLCIPILIVAFFIKWLSGPLPLYRNLADSVKQTNLFFEVGYWKINAYAKQIPLSVIRTAAATVDSISLILFLWGTLCFIKLLRLYYADEVFSKKTLTLYAKISKIAFAWTLYNPLKFTLLSAITTLANPTGKQFVAFALSSHDVYHIFISGFFVWITSIMQTAYTLKQENDLTV